MAQVPKAVAKFKAGASVGPGDLVDEDSRWQFDQEELHMRSASKHTRRLFRLLRNDKHSPNKLEWSNVTLQALLTKGADIGFTDIKGVSLLHIAASSGNNHICHHLLETIDVNKPDTYGRTPLHEAIASGFEETVEFLLENGANLFAATFSGETCVHIAARYDQAALIYYLLLRAEDFYENDAKHHPLLPKDVSKMAHSMSRRGSNRKMTVVPESDDGSTVPILCACLSHIDFPDCHGFTHFNRSDPRLQALRSSRLLLPQVKDSPLLNAYSSLPNASSLSLAQEIFRDRRDSLGRTALHLAASMDRDVAAKALLELGCDPGTVDFEGRTSLQHMIFNMPNVASEALDLFTQYDRPARKVKYYIKFLEPSPLQRNLAKERKNNRRNSHFAQLEDGRPRYELSIIEGIVAKNRLNLITKPAIEYLIKKKWEQFAYVKVIIQILLYLFFLVVWTAISLSAYETERTNYHNKQWRIVLEGFGVLLLLFFILDELREISTQILKQRRWRDDEVKLYTTELENLNPAWEDHKFLLLKQKAVRSRSALGVYLSDVWNYIDWMSYILLACATATHVANLLLDISFLNTLHTRFLAIGLITSWLKLLKFARVFKSAGPFVVILGSLFKDTLKFVVIYVDVLVPFTLAFILLFGGDANLTSLSTFQDALMLVYRMQYIDYEYDYGTMASADRVMAPMLMAVWIFLSSVMFVNLFIAMMSDTFQRIHDNAKSVAAMQHADAILDLQEYLPPRDLASYRDEIHSNPSPFFSEDYDDDDDDQYDLVNLRKEILEEVAAQGNRLTKLEDNVSEILNLLKAQQSNNSAGSAPNNNINRNLEDDLLSSNTAPPAATKKRASALSLRTADSMPSTNRPVGRFLRVENNESPEPQEYQAHPRPPPKVKRFAEVVGEVIHHPQKAQDASSSGTRVPVQSRSQSLKRPGAMPHSQSPSPPPPTSLSPTPQPPSSRPDFQQMQSIKDPYASDPRTPYLRYPDHSQTQFQPSHVDQGLFPETQHVQHQTPRAPPPLPSPQQYYPPQQMMPSSVDQPFTSDAELRKSVPGQPAPPRGGVHVLPPVRGIRPPQGPTNAAPSSRPFQSHPPPTRLPPVSNTPSIRISDNSMNGSYFDPDFPPPNMGESSI